MKKDYGVELLKVLRSQRQAFIRLADGEKLVTNPLLYRQCEEEALHLQEVIGRENKRRIKNECDEKSIPYPNFKKESRNNHIT